MSVAQANVSIERAQIKSSEIIVTVSGEDAKILKTFISGYDNEVDSVIAKAANTDDYSSIRAIACAGEVCTVRAEASAYGKADTQDYYDKDFNQKLRGLQDDQVVVMSNAKEMTGAKSSYEARILRLMIENAQGLKNVSSKNFKANSLKQADLVSSLLYEVRLDLSSLSIVCYSSIVTGMGVQNFLSENCSFTATANVK